MYVNESVRSPPSSGAVACTVAPDWVSATAPSAGPLVVYVSVSPASGSVTSAARSMLVGVPASTAIVESVAVGAVLAGATTSIVTAPATVWPCWSSTAYANVAAPANPLSGVNVTRSWPAPLTIVAADPPWGSSQHEK